MRERYEGEENSELNFDKAELAFLHEFLISQKTALDALINSSGDETIGVDVVLGNESADLDSVVSSILRAYHLYLQGNKTGIIAPCINIFREELALRKDLIYLFQNLGISLTSLLFIDDQISLDLLADKYQLRLHLVDHNQLNPDQEHLAPYVCDIVDHHLDAKIDYPNPVTKQIQTIGSCTTLIANELFKTWPLDAIPASLAAFILAPVLIDTDNLLSLEKTTEADLELAQALFLHVGDKLPLDYYARLREKKSDISGIPEYLLLFKDFKKFKVLERNEKGEVLADGTSLVYGISSMVSSSAFWLESAERLENDFKAVLNNRSLSLHILLMPFSSEKGDPRRKIVLYSNSNLISSGFYTLLSEFSELHSRMTFQESSLGLYFYTTEKFISRKEFQPLIDLIFRSPKFMHLLSGSDVHAHEKKTLVKRNRDDFGFFSSDAIGTASSSNMVESEVQDNQSKKIRSS